MGNGYAYPLFQLYDGEIGCSVMLPALEDIASLYSPPLCRQRGYH